MTLGPSATLVRIPLESDASPLEVLATAGDDERPFGLVGAWAGGGAIIGSEPLVSVTGAREALAALDDLPRVSGRGDGAVGGGWVGYLGYGTGSLFERLPPRPHRPVPLPDAEMAFYDHLVHFDASSRQWYFEALTTLPRAGELARRCDIWRRRLASPTTVPTRQAGVGPFRPRPSGAAHVAAVARAVEHIVAGELFQVNVCMRLEAQFAGCPLSLFRAAADVLAPRYGAFLGGERVAVASFSPELFLRRRGEDVVTSPVKGTVRRQGEASSPEVAAALSASAKDRAENLMIVDLMRNDLGRVASVGSVAVPTLYRVEAHPGVFHLVSDVTARIPAEVSNADLLAATFPPGSVTGAPKVRAMQAICELEATGREVYTGAIGIASPLSGLELNVAIRTAEISASRLWLGVGGGIVADSSPEAELAECEAKAAPLVAALTRERVAATTSR